MRNSSSESNTFSSRYDLPTCSLEVWTERSPLSDWQAQIVAQNLHFQLQLANGQKIIEGNQQQITNLIEAVTNYCDRWLAQDDFESLDHAIEIPKLSKLELSTLQLFDLYESLELCANEFVILPNVLIEVRRLNPNWLKIIAGAITIVGVTIGAVRLISPPFGEQPSYQIASTPSTSSLEKVSVAPSTRLENTLEGKVAVAPKSAEKKPNAAIAPTAPNASQPVQTSNQGLNQDLRFESKISIKTDKVAIIPEVTNNSTSSDRQRAVVNSPSITDGMTAGSTASQSGRLQLPNKDIPSPATIAAEASKSSPIEPSANLPLPSATSRSANTDILINIKVIQIQSELSSNITTDLVRYLQSQRLNSSVTGTLNLQLEISGDRPKNISTDNQNSTLKDNNTISEIENILLQWRSPNSVTGKVRLVLLLK
jgi:hypothetical protein